jgi:hypothetical protein
MFQNRLKQAFDVNGIDMSMNFKDGRTEGQTRALRVGAADEL